MYSTDTLIRTSDRKEFRVAFHSHVSTIRAEDGEEDAVKWGWGRGTISEPDPMRYYSMTGGHEYRVKDR